MVPSQSNQLNKFGTVTYMLECMKTSRTGQCRVCVVCLHGGTGEGMSMPFTTEVTIQFNSSHQLFFIIKYHGTQDRKIGLGCSY